MKPSDDSSQEQASDRDLLRYKKLFRCVVILKQHTSIPRLIRLGEDADIKDKMCRKALLKYAESGDADRVDILLKIKADPNTCDDSFRIPVLIEASIRGHVDVVRLLLNAQANPDIEDHLGRLALVSASGCGHTDVVHLLIDAHANVDDPQGLEGYTPLMCAAARGRIKVVEALIEAKADPNIKTLHGNTALMLASQGHKEYPILPSSPFLAIIRVLVAAGANLWLKNDNEMTVFMTILHDKNLLSFEQSSLLEALNPEGITCSICRENNGGEFALLEPCGHCFHTRCINNWFHSIVDHAEADDTEAVLICPNCRVTAAHYDRTFVLAPSQAEEMKEVE